MANASIDLLSIACSRLLNRTGKRAATAKLDQWSLEDWRAAFLDIPLEERTYADRLGIERLAEIQGLWMWWSRPEDRVAEFGPEATGYLGFFLLTLIAMDCSDRMRYHGEAYGDGKVGGWHRDRLCRELVADPYVQQAIQDLYAPAEADEQAETRWATIDFATMAFHRHGTTSIILTVDSVAPETGRPERYALKCLVYPYLRISAIVKATKNYEQEFGHFRREWSSLVAVWASHDSWVLMEFVEGPTLAEHLRHIAQGRKQPKSEILRPVDIEQLRVLGVALLAALVDLASIGHRHSDLTPSNIIVEAEGHITVKIRLIDLGVNFLHTRTIPGGETGEAGFVAPEVKAHGIGRRADLYSLGMLLIAIGGIPHTTDGTVPDQFYVTSIGLARLLEDLLDADPDRRLLVSGIESGAASFTQIRDIFVRELEVIEAVEPDKPQSFLNRMQHIMPDAGGVERQRKIWKIRHRQAMRTDAATHPMQAHHLRQAKWLKRWALACAWMSSMTLLLVMVWWARDLGADWAARWVELANAYLDRGQEQGVPILDDVRAADYPMPDAWGNLPVRIVAITYLLPAARLYLNIFADMTPHSALRRHGRAGARTAAASFMMRASAVCPVVYVLVPTLVQRDWWVIFCPLGIITAAATASVCLWFARDANARARRAGLSTVPKGDIMTLDRLASWAPAAWLYAAPVVIIGILLYNGRLQDELMYAIVIGLINIGIWYFKNTGFDAPYLRAGLNRAILAAERLDALDARAVWPNRRPNR